MADRKQALASAQFAANRAGVPYVIYKVNNGQYMFGSLTWYQEHEESKPYHMMETIYPKRRDRDNYHNPYDPQVRRLHDHNEFIDHNYGHVRCDACDDFAAVILTATRGGDGGGSKTILVCKAHLLDPGPLLDW